MEIIDPSGNTVKVFSFTLFDIKTRKNVASHQYGTAAAIAATKGAAQGAAIAIPAGDVDGNGLTAVGYIPLTRT
ncbi:hypothetical protein [Janthinobacterium sp. 75]|uniref:hypothetical protein n=1 Tax=Janthinobacterium sp. 75 TaxID=2135628 RepID=UPI0010643D8E|nr:hypothetical protein [Janthinobacterium sp. 75]